MLRMVCIKFIKKNYFFLFFILLINEFFFGNIYNMVNEILMIRKYNIKCWCCFL